MDTHNRRFNEILASRWLPWTLAGVTGLVILLELAWQPAWSALLPKAGQAAVWVLAVALLLISYLANVRLHHALDEWRKAEEKLAQAEARVDDIVRQMELIFQVSRKFIDATDENQVIEPVLRLIVDLSGATGASFVPIDEHGQPQTAISHGEMPFPIMDAWLEYLATPGIRDRCRECDDRDAPEPLLFRAECPLLRGPFSETKGMACLSVRRGEREFGVLNLFLPETADLEPRTRVLIDTLLDETALGLEGIYLRRREISALHQLQFLRQKSDLTALLNGLLGNVSQTLGADFAIMTVPASGRFPQGIDLVEGDLPPQGRPFIDGLLQGVLTSRQPVLLVDLAGDPGGSAEVRPFVKSLVAAPLISGEGSVLGAILVGNRPVKGGGYAGKSPARSFQPRQLALLQTIASQVALVVQNASLMAELEYQIMFQERARLAREIHDGLAQTIGFLKLQAAQLRSFLSKDDIERARQSAEIFYSTLTEAYQDARQAIDGLRISPDECGLQGWLAQIAAEFRDASGLPVSVEDVQLDGNLSSEVQAQLIRIVQEALSNVRKHAQATQVWIGCRELDGDLLLEVRDDGRGFAPQDVTSASQHGLRGMRERAELIGADFQVASRPQAGTTVRVRLPLKRVEETAV